MLKFSILLVVLYFGVLALSAPMKIENVENPDPTLGDGIQFFDFFDAESGSEITGWDCSKFNTSFANDPICIQLKEQFKNNINQLKPFFKSLFLSVKVDNEKGASVVFGGSVKIGDTTVIKTRDADDMQKFQHRIVPRKDAEIDNSIIESFEDDLTIVDGINFYELYDEKSGIELIGWNCSKSNISFANDPICVQLKEEFQKIINQLKPSFDTIFLSVRADDDEVFLLMGGSVRIGRKTKDVHDDDTDVDDDDADAVHNLLNDEKDENNEIPDFEFENNLKDESIEAEDKEEDLAIHQNQNEDESWILYC